MGNICGIEKDRETKFNNEHNNNSESGYIIDDDKKNIISSTLKKEISNNISKDIIGEWFKNFSNKMNKMLPIYLIFNTKYDLDILNCYDNFNSAKVNWEKIKSLLNSAVKICENEDIFWEEKTSDAFIIKLII